MESEPGLNYAATSGCWVTGILFTTVRYCSIAEKTGNEQMTSQERVLVTDNQWLSDTWSYMHTPTPATRHFSIEFTVQEIRYR